MPNVLKLLKLQIDNKTDLLKFRLTSGIVVEWLKTGCDKSTDELSNIVAVCIFGK